ncbi:Anticodon-binding domain of tRNA [Musa troglodytarum]|uniref:leucine--tRNA ligase n=1 Tax=Musa troglodytarum TaxID=320322 RepID=A0A9E7HK30_9LILI|nr:Anticodon-binding domain of tRNA [Musa troglodytarum]
MQTQARTRASLRFQAFPHFANGAPRPFVISFPPTRRHVRVRCSAASDGGSIGGNPQPQVQQRKAYPFDAIEPRWQRYWEENRTFRTPDEVDTSKPKCYILDMFPYPSGAGLHVGHPLGYTATDILSRYKQNEGLQCFASDGLGCLKSLGFSYDWDRELSTTEPEYYKWTQWIFLQLFKKGLAYQAEIPVNWCPALGTVLANEEVVNGVSERGGHPVVRKPMRQWILKITAYADRLLEDLDDLDWPESIKEMQRNWIGRSEGAELEFGVVDSQGYEQGLKLFIVVAPEHPLLSSLTTEAQHEKVEHYGELASKKSKDRSFSGSYAINPATRETIPIWIADYVLGSYGTGAIMAVPAHDSRDYEFALKYDIPIIRVVSRTDRSDDDSEPYVDDGIMINSSNSLSGLNINGLSCKDAASKVIEWLESTGHGIKKVNYKLRDWLFARQRYWGEPFPVVYLDDSGEVVPLQENELPLVLPDLDDFNPTGTGEPPLAKARSWVNTVDPVSGRHARRNKYNATMGWYYLRFMDPKNPTALVDKDKERYWSPVDIYVGGAEHSVLHLLYARFWHKVLYDIGVVSTKEPFQCLINQGLILGEIEYTAFKDQEGRLVSAESVGITDNHFQERIPAEKYSRLVARAYKMSKSRGNVINPDDVVSEYGADSLRLYEMFMGPLRDSKTWSTGGIEGVHRFLARTWRLIVGPPLPDGSYNCGTIATDDEPTLDQLRSLHRCIAKVSEEIQETRFNTGISAMMEFVNAAYKPFVLLLSPFAPHMAEELWSRMGHQESLAYEQFPEAESEFLKDSNIVLPVQINGKTRGTILVDEACSEDDAFRLASEDEKLSKYISERMIKKRIFVPGRILNVILDHHKINREKVVEEAGTRANHAI